MTDRRAVRKYARDSVRQARTISGLARAPQLATSSIENGAIESYDAEGTLAAVIGKQFDGSQGVLATTGPTPPTATAPILTPGRASLTARWDGIFLGSDGAPDITVTPTLDHARVEVHASQDPDADPVGFDSLVATIETPRGGDAVLGPLGPGEWRVWFVVRSLAGKYGGASPVAVGSPLEDLGEEVASANGRITVAAVDPILADGEGKPEGALWIKMVDDPVLGKKHAATWAWTSGAWAAKVPESVDIQTGTFGYLSGARLVASSVKAAQIDTDDLAAKTAFIDALKAKIVVSDAFVGKTFTGGTFTGVAINGGTITMANLGYSVALKSITGGSAITFGAPNLIAEAQIMGDSSGGMQITSGTRSGFGVKGNLRVLAGKSATDANLRPTLSTDSDMYFSGQNTVLTFDGGGTTELSAYGGSYMKLGWSDRADYSPAIWLGSDATGERIYSRGIYGREYGTVGGSGTGNAQGSSTRPMVMTSNGTFGVLKAGSRFHRDDVGVYSGTFTIPGAIAANGGTFSYDVVFPTPFTSTPKVVADTSAARLTESVTNVTLTGCTVNVYNWTSGATPAGNATGTWIAAV